MKRRVTLLISSYFIILMACLSWVSGTSRPFSPHHQQAQSIPQPPVLQAVSNSTNGVQSLKEVRRTTKPNGNDEEYRGMSRLGSRPPNCGHKCGVCFPCEAVQIPTTNDRLSLLISNYEPEGWKCKCGLSFFDP